MPILLFNDSWMVFNSFLALLAVFFGYLALRTKIIYIKVLFGLFWLLFLPNTIYIFTDLEHLIEQWNDVVPSLHLTLLVQYFFFEAVGIVTFLFALLPFEKFMRTEKSLKKDILPLLIIFNFIIAFGMVLGRIERINSWEVFTNPSRVVGSAITVVTSIDLIGLTIVFGLLCNFIYFLFRDKLLLYTKRLL